MLYLINGKMSDCNIGIVYNADGISKIFGVHGKYDLLSGVRPNARGTIIECIITWA